MSSSRSSYRALVALLLILGGHPAIAGPGEGPPHGARSMEHRESRVLDALERLDEDRHQKVIILREARPVLYRRFVLTEVRGMRGRGESPPIERLGLMIDRAFALHRALEAHQSAPPAEQGSRRAEIEAAASALFDLRQEGRKEQLVRLEARLERMKAEITERESRKEDLIRRFLEHLDRGAAEDEEEL
ncbi:MAG: hypothetical protein EA397_13090 [Deltaproteobacteria bacterium]|nr:MAG: hypothetical protein EA397_13090 [Deltaproteobacteria bacterium]